MVERAYIPALRYKFLTGLFDALIGATTREGRIRRTVVELSGIGNCCRVLDVGSGTGTLATLIKQSNPGARVVGIDVDAEILDLAREKARGQKVEVEFRKAFADDLPFGDGEFDVVVSSLLFHHLPTTVKKGALREVHRVLRPGGVFLLADWGRPTSAIERLQFYSVQLLDGFKTTTDNVRGRLPQFGREAGFEDFREVAKERTVYGVLSFYRGRRSS